MSLGNLGFRGVDRFVPFWAALLTGVCMMLDPKAPGNGIIYFGGSKYLLYNDTWTLWGLETLRCSSRSHSCNAGSGSRNARPPNPNGKQLEVSDMRRHLMGILVEQGLRSDA